MQTRTGHAEVNNIDINIISTNIIKYININSICINISNINIINISIISCLGCGLYLMAGIGSLHKQGNPDIGNKPQNQETLNPKLNPDIDNKPLQSLFWGPFLETRSS